MLKNKALFLKREKKPKRKKRLQKAANNTEKEKNIKKEQWILSAINIIGKM